MLFLLRRGPGGPSPKVRTFCNSGWPDSGKFYGLIAYPYSTASAHIPQKQKKQWKEMVRFRLQPINPRHYHNFWNVQWTSTLGNGLTGEPRNGKTFFRVVAVSKDPEWLPPGDAKGWHRDCWGKTCARHNPTWNASFEFWKQSKVINYLNYPNIAVLVAADWWHWSSQLVIRRHSYSPIRNVCKVSSPGANINDVAWWHHP